MNILAAGMRCYQKLCGHIVFHVMGPPRCRRTILSTARILCPWEITAGSRRVEFQNDLSAEQYAALMNDNVEDLTELRLWSLEKIKENKAKVARAYNKKVNPKDFQVGDLVWEAVLPLGTKDKRFGKWSPTWHGPYKVDQVLPGNAYMLEELDGVKFPVAVNGQHLKKYFPSMWEGE